MAHLIRICGGVSAAALAVALGFAFWPQFDRSLAGSRTAVEKPVFVVRATPVKLAAAVPPPAAEPAPIAAPAAAPPAGAAAAGTITKVAPTPPAAPAQADPALTKLAMALRANGTGQPPSPSDLGATRGLALASSGAPAASEEARRLCAQGLVALAQGSIASARAYLQRAADAGDARALLALGETYDPVTLARIGVLGLKGDAARARDYYAQALAAGLSIARERMAALNAP
jgi:TPR repeat protein